MFTNGEKVAMTVHRVERPIPTASMPQLWGLLKKQFQVDLI
jgi:hypothetical protein